MHDENKRTTPEMESDESLDASQKESKEEDVAYCRDQWMRAVAENENVHRRAEKEKAHAVKYALSSFAEDLLTVADHMERALGSVPEDQMQDNPLLQGVSMTLEQLHATFKRFHVEKVKTAIGDTPNPQHHQAIEEKEHPTAPAHTISHVLQEGYCLHDRLLRPALVVVSSGSSLQE